MGQKKTLREFAVWLENQGLLKDMGEKPDDTRCIRELVKDFRRQQK
ncbi:hypothetical protein [Mycobacterium intracellulare]|uniref:Uncharacterized protein n=1 Tax=Mycobacterium intracellulare TaxID=1767 RepID=A0AAE4RA01_MYCIT|nr:hypothetical protein [Mycobacterium intracellulare]MDV6975280.1 hypothetical protein [Mycobacterium intracellulare]MDV6980344.1 hypothetical protein [Mycobacterium intracellulare]MDV7010773.1 hypothetical protein [Mycobacterium intracellulare]MDV7025679.1 hypothetical protein [Mycobacterium intracellulare]